jgi:UDP-N-acetylglucosamine:LPS N-acetylglucosamine transferase
MMARPRVLLVASPGGHLLQMLALRPAWADLERTWVTLDAADTRALLTDEDVVLAHGPTTRNVPNALRNLRLADRIMRRRRPDAILSTGAALAVPFFLAGRAHGARLVYVESLARVEGLALSGRLVLPLADRFFVQWPEATRRRKAVFAGSVL